MTRYATIESVGDLISDDYSKDFDAKLRQQMESNDWHLLVSETPDIDGVRDKDRFSTIKRVLDGTALAIRDDKTIFFLIANLFDRKGAKSSPHSDSFVVAISSQEFFGTEV